MMFDNKVRRYLKVIPISNQFTNFFSLIDSYYSYCLWFTDLERTSQMASLVELNGYFSEHLWALDDDSGIPTEIDHQLYDSINAKHAQTDITQQLLPCLHRWYTDIKQRVEVTHEPFAPIPSSAFLDVSHANPFDPIPIPILRWLSVPSKPTQPPLDTSATLDVAPAPSDDVPPPPPPPPTPTPPPTTAPPKGIKGNTKKKSVPGSEL
jgi:hypothetical protein